MFKETPVHRPRVHDYDAEGLQVGIEDTQSHVPAIVAEIDDQPSAPSLTIIPSPVKLNFIEELPATSNADTVSLGGVLGNVMIRECWLFNYLFDVDFVM